MRNKITIKGIFTPIYVITQKDLTVEESYIFSIMLNTSNQHEKIDYTNQAYADIIGRDVRTITRCINMLIKRNYIRVVGSGKKREFKLTSKIFDLKKEFENKKGGI